VFSTPERVVADDLEHVQVPGDDGRGEVLRLGLDGQRPDDVVGLEAGQLVDREAERLHDLADLRELVPQVVGHPRPRRLVLGEALVAEGRAGKVESDRDVVGVEVLDPPQDDAAEAEDRVHELALRRREGREGEVSAVDEPVAVEQHQAFHRRASTGVVRGIAGRAVKCTGAGSWPGSRRLAPPVSAPRGPRPQSLSGSETSGVR